ncbi:MAG: YtxH domain-containing protein [Candidatus Gottesmanbacteria bacterium]
MNDNNRDNKFMIGFFVGGLIGAGLMFLMGTKEGKKIEKLIEKKGKETLEDLEEKVDELKEKGEELIKKGEAIKDQVMEQIEDKKEDLTEEATKRLDSALANVVEIQEKGLTTTTNLRKRLFKNIPKR